MFPFKKVLCPTDFSEASLCGLRLADKMARMWDVEVIVLNVHKPIPSLPKPRVEASEVSFDVAAYEKVVVEDARHNLEEVAARMLGESIDVRLEVRIGEPAQEILEMAEEEDVDAILIATHGRTGIAHIVFGSVAQRVVRRARCPVVTIPMCEQESV